MYLFSPDLFWRFTELPQVVYSLPKLEIMLANDNKISAVDAGKLRALPCLATLDLQNNNIATVPPELGLCAQLK